MGRFFGGGEGREKNPLEEHRTERMDESSVEKEPVPRAIFSIDIARHSLKGPKPREALSEEGLLKAVEAGKASPLGKRTKAKAAKGEPLEIYTSPRERTGQSALSRMLSEQLAEVGFKDMDPEDLVKWLEGKGVEKTESPALNFLLGEGEYQDELMADFKKNEYMKFMVDKSDDLALKTKHDPDTVTTLTQQARNVGAFFLALGSLKTNEMMKSGEKKSDFAFAATHGGVLEAFLYKVIKMKEGEQAAADFVEKDLGNNMFQENQGIIAKYEALGDKPEEMRLVLDYNGREYKLDFDELAKIIQEGQDYEKQLQAAHDAK